MPMAIAKTPEPDRVAPAICEGKKHAIDKRKNADAKRYVSDCEVLWLQRVHFPSRQIPSGNSPHGLEPPLDRAPVGCR
jgi:hypothetical protein